MRNIVWVHRKKYAVMSAVKKMLGYNPYFHIFMFVSKSVKTAFLSRCNWAAEASTRARSEKREASTTQHGLSTLHYVRASHWPMTIHHAATRE